MIGCFSKITLSLSLCSLIMMITHHRQSGGVGRGVASAGGAGVASSSATDVARPRSGRFSRHHRNAPPRSQPRPQPRAESCAESRGRPQRRKWRRAPSPAASVIHYYPSALAAKQQPWRRRRRWFGPERAEELGVAGVAGSRGVGTDDDDDRSPWRRRQRLRGQW